MLSIEFLLVFKEISFLVRRSPRTTKLVGFSNAFLIGLILELVSPGSVRSGYSTESVPRKQVGR
jgi:hypothetical protein